MTTQQEDNKSSEEDDMVRHQGNMAALYPRRSVSSTLYLTRTYQPPYVPHNAAHGPAQEIQGISVTFGPLAIPDQTVRVCD